MVMEITIPDGADFLGPGFFGWPSLEYQIENYYINYDTAKGCTLKVDALPTSVYLALWGVSQILPERFGIRGRSIANAERLVLSIGIGIIQCII